MNSDLPLETAVICFSSGISSEFDMVDVSRALRNADEELQNKNSLLTVGFEPVTFRLRIERANHCSTRSDIHRTLKS